MGKNLTAKTSSGDFQVTIPKTLLLSQQAVTSKESSTLPTYNWTLTLIHNRTCSVVTVSLFDARLPSTWLTVARILVRDFKTPIRKDCWLQSSSVHPHDEDQEDAWSQNPMVQIHSNFSKRKRWTRSRTLSPVTICLNRVCSILVQLVYRLTALKKILLYV